MKTNLIRSSILTCILCFAFTVGAVEKNGHSSTMTKSSAIEQVKENTQESSGAKIGKISFKERLKLLRELRKEIRKTKKGGSDVPMVLLYILAILLPPLAVGLFTNWGEPTLWDLVLTILFWIPGVIYAFYILLK